MSISQVTIGDKVYQMSRQLAANLINIAKEKYAQERSYAIVAIEKGNQIELRRDTFESEKAMKLQIKAFKENGFKVYYVKRW